jgi:hypothetical protein
MTTALIHTTSLGRTVDAANAVLFAGDVLTRDERTTLGRWLAARQGLPGAYAGTFAGFPHERANGIVTFTGERITSASARHILGEETCRLLRLLAPNAEGVAAALERADRALQQRVDAAVGEGRNDNPGLYCCGKCTVGFWRNVQSGGLDRREERLERGVAHLRAMREGSGGWRTFPFWYTVLALTDIDFASARAELHYAAAKLQRATARKPSRETYGRRRQTLAARALAKV